MAAPPAKIDPKRAYLITGKTLKKLLAGVKGGAGITATPQVDGTVTISLANMRRVYIISAGVATPVLIPIEPTF